jgi:hypothetical protein
LPRLVTDAARGRVTDADHAHDLERRRVSVDLNPVVRRSCTCLPTLGASRSPASDALLMLGVSL